MWFRIANGCSTWNIVPLNCVERAVPLYVPRGTFGSALKAPLGRLALVGYKPE